MKSRQALDLPALRLGVITLASLLWTMPAAVAQNGGRPDPAAPVSQAGEGQEGSNRRRGNGGETAPGRRQSPGDDELVKLGFSDVDVKETFGFVAESTGKVVMPVNPLTLQNKKITLLNDELIPRSEALDLLFQSFRLNGVGIIERSDVVIIGTIDDLAQLKLQPVLTAEDDIMDRQDRGSMVVKLYKLENVKAEEIGEQLREDLPSYASLQIDANSNQLILSADLGLCQHYQQLIDELDNVYVQPETRTFRLAHADASEISDNIFDLFEPSAAPASPQQRARQVRGQAGRSPQAPRLPGSTVTPEVELRVTVNASQNSVTVTAEPAIVKEIARLVDEEWDLPRPTGTSKIYTLQYTDPIKVAEKLNALLGQGSGPTGGGRRAGAAGQGPASVEQILSGIYRLEPYPDTNQLFVFSKTVDSLEFLDEFIEQLDQPTSIGLPFVTELKHASAIELAEQLNALLAEAGAQATIERPDEGLTFGGIDDPNDPSGGGGGGQQAGPAGTLSFPWQRGGRAADEETPQSPLIGKVRIVPVVRQNALAVLCPRPQQEAVRELIDFFDRPGRQVMISAIIAEVELTDELALGLRFSNSDEVLSGANPDFRIGGTFGLEATEDNFLSIFDTSTLTLNTSVNVALQALAQKTNVRILQEPIIFTADNQEAYFFDGQDIPFITSTVINTEGNPTNSFDYRAVGVALNVRPRITVERDVDIEVNLEISSVVPGVTLFGGAIIDRRQSATHVIVKNQQTIVISGILREEESKIKRGLPLLSDLPLIGDLFASHENTTTTTELIAFITPYVVDNPSENDSNFQGDYRQRLDELSRPVLEQADLLKENPEKYRERVVPEFILHPEESSGGE